jgi:murein DD-endopeptidase MepM/ murein hydrolase activator NlpD
MGVDFMSKYKKAAVAFIFLILLWISLFVILFVLKAIHANKILNFKGEVNIFIEQNDKGNEIYTFLATEKNYYKTMFLLGASGANNMPKNLEYQLRNSLSNFASSKGSTNYYFNVWDSNRENLIKSYGLAPKVTQPSTTAANKPLGTSLNTQIELQWPVKVSPIKISSGYGYRILSGRVNAHGGIDLAVPSGTEIYPAYLPAKVIRVGGGCEEVKKSCTTQKCEKEDKECCCNNGLGNFVVLEHTLPNGEVFYTHYDHLSIVYVKENELITNEKTLGKSGNTGYSEDPHLHFELNKDKIKNDETSINPCPYLPNPPSNCEQESLKMAKRGVTEGSATYVDIPLPNGERGKLELIL